MIQKMNMPGIKVHKMAAKITEEHKTAITRVKDKVKVRAKERELTSNYLKRSVTLSATTLLKRYFPAQALLSYSSLWVFSQLLFKQVFKLLQLRWAELAFSKSERTHVRHAGISAHC